LGEAARGAEFVKVFVAAFASLLVSPALATEPQVGRWAIEAQNCNGGGDTQKTSALTVTPTTVAWAAEFCTIGKMYKADQALYIEGRCSSGGNMTKHPITLQMKGDRLAVTWNGERIQEMQRCR
jgi:hypothetical protein